MTSEQIRAMKLPSVDMPRLTAEGVASLNARMAMAQLALWREIAAQLAQISEELGRISYGVTR